MASGPLGWALLLVALAGAVLLVAADFSEISYRTIGIGACSDRVDPGVCRTYGHDSHSFVLSVVGLVALLMAWGAVIGRSRAAAVAVAALGVVVLFIALVIDLPKLDDKRGLEVRYNDVAAHTGSAFKLELAGGVLLLLAGGLALMRAGSEAKAWQPPRRRSRAEAPSTDDGSDGSESAAEARARERARRRAARSRSPVPPDKMPPPEPGTAAGDEAGAPVATEPTAGPAPGAATEAAPTPGPHVRGPTDPPDTGAVASPEPELGTAGDAPEADAEPDPDAYRRPSPEPEPPARG